MKSKNILLIITLTIVSSFSIFIIKNYFFWWIENFENEIIEENYLEKVVQDLIPTFSQNEEIVSDNDIENIIELPSATEKINYTYIPWSFWEENKIKTYHWIYDVFLNYNPIWESISSLDVILYKPKWETRWKMQNKKIKLFGIYNMKLWEYLAVCIHEFAHFLDLYILQKQNWIDTSDYFYQISWKDIKILKAWLTQKDFVSWYAMTNQYEDFAETYTYYILHNSDFLEKSTKSSILKQKYNFFKTYIFKNDEFISIKLKTEEEIKDYYRDTTKIWYSLQNLLSYLIKWV